MSPASVEVRAADLADPAQAITVARGAAVIYQVLNPPYHRWAAEWPALWHPIGREAAEVLAWRDCLSVTASPSRSSMSRLSEGCPAQRFDLVRTILSETF
jgi:hypothetical protein